MLPAMANSREEHIRGDDGHAFTGYLAIPESGSGPGMVVAQEIFGVTDYIKDVCARLSELGYVALAPDLYSRIDGESLIDERTENALPRAFGAMQKLDFPQAAGDAADALGHLRELPEVPDGRAGIIGFCLGGGIAYFVAADSDPDVAVMYYGSAIPREPRQGSRRCNVRCSSISVTPMSTSPPSNVPRSSRHLPDARTPSSTCITAPTTRSTITTAVFHHPEAAAAAWKQTVAFLERELPA